MPLVLVGLAVLLLGVPAGKRALLFGTPPIFIVTVAGGVALVMNLVFAMRPGCSGNYLFETWVAGMTLTGLIQRHAVTDLEQFTKPIHRFALAGFICLLLLSSLDSVLPLFRPPAPGDMIAQEMTARLPPPNYSEQLLEDLRNSPRPIFCDDMVPSFTYSPASFLVRQALGSDSSEIPVIDHTVYWDAWRAGRLSKPDIQERIKQREYATIWLYGEHSTWEQFVKEAGYEAVKQDGIFKQYRRPSGRGP
jgi:hypothetical protein